MISKPVLCPEGRPTLAANTFLRDGLGKEHLWLCILDLSSNNVPRWHESN